MRWIVVLPLLGVLVAAAPRIERPTPCAALATPGGARLPNSTTRIESATTNAAREAQGNAPAYPEHCEVVGRINERTGANGQRYAIRFHLRLPAAAISPSA